MQARVMKLEHEDTSKWYTECLEYLLLHPEYTKRLLSIQKKKSCTLPDILYFICGWSLCKSKRDKFAPSITVIPSFNRRGALRLSTKALLHVSARCLNSAISLSSCYFHKFVWMKSPLHERTSTSFPSPYWFWRLSTQVCFQAFWEGAPNTCNLTPEDSGPAVRENKQNRKVIYWQV